MLFPFRGEHAASAARRSGRTRFKEGFTLQSRGCGRMKAMRGICGHLHPEPGRMGRPLFRAARVLPQGDRSPLLRRSMGNWRSSRSSRARSRREEGDRRDSNPRPNASARRVERARGRLGAGAFGRSGGPRRPLVALGGSEPRRSPPTHPGRERGGTDRLPLRRPRASARPRPDARGGGARARRVVERGSGARWSSRCVKECAFSGSVDNRANPASLRGLRGRLPRRRGG